MNFFNCYLSHLDVEDTCYEIDEKNVAMKRYKRYNIS
jgi:hypothetical protein